MQDGWTASFGCGNGEERSLQYVEYIFSPSISALVQLSRPTWQSGLCWVLVAQILLAQEVNNQLGGQQSK